jgi:hypothetical protein
MLPRKSTGGAAHTGEEKAMSSNMEMIRKLFLMNRFPEKFG